MAGSCWSMITTEESVKLHKRHIHELPPETLFVRVSHPDGTVWAIPSEAVVTRAARYYEREGWDQGSPKSKQPKGKNLLGILWANPDTEHWAKEQQWSKFDGVAVLIAGPGTIPPGDDQLWWFEEAGGELEEMTTLTLNGQVRRHGRLLVLDDVAMAALGIDAP